MSLQWEWCDSNAMITIVRHVSRPSPNFLYGLFLVAINFWSLEAASTSPEPLATTLAPTRLSTCPITVTNNIKIVALIKYSKSHFNLAAVLCERHGALLTPILFKLSFVTNTVAFINSGVLPPARLAISFPPYIRRKWRNVPTHTVNSERRLVWVRLAHVA